MNYLTIRQSLGSVLEFRPGGSYSSGGASHCECAVFTCSSWHRDTAPPASGLPMSSVCGALQHHLVLIVPHRLGFSLRASLQLFFSRHDRWTRKKPKAFHLEIGIQEGISLKPEESFLCG